MSRQSIHQPRNLPLTEELERLEQSITLVLQEIDHNFSRAHRIVSGSIIPIVEQYAKHSDAVWEGSKFWKQFFEASANVSLSSYEEEAEDDLTVTEQYETGHGDRQRGTPSGNDDDTVTASGQKPSSRHEDDMEVSSILDSPSVTIGQQGTPSTEQTSRHKDTSFADYSSPYESLKEEMGDGTRAKPGQSTNPSTPGRRPASTAQTPQNQSSPGVPPSITQQQNIQRQNNDPLLHRVLDKNYRIGTTPHGTRKQPSVVQAAAPTATATKITHDTARSTNPALDSSPFSPAIAAPELRSEIFGSPSRGGPRTPGVSVQKGKGKTPLGQRGSSKALFTAKHQNEQQTQQQRTLADPTTWNDKLWDSDSDTADDFGVRSPPKTMQFHVPQSRLLQTPAKEASRRIVEDLLSTAGAASVTSTLDDFDVDLTLGGEGDDGNARGYRYGGVGDDDSPSIVRTAQRDHDEEAF